MKLTKRQRQIWILISMGESRKEVASSLGISVKAVDFHRDALAASLGIRRANDVQLCRRALQAGLVPV